MLTNAMVFSRFRYLAYSRIPPKSITNAIIEDTQAMIWQKELLYDPDTLGTPLTSKRGQSQDSQFLPRLEGGIGALHWPAHLKAIAAIALFRYNDGTQDDWKHVLDHWFDRYQEGRGAVFSTIPISDLTKSTTGRVSGLPPFFKAALTHLRLLKPTPISSDKYTSQDEARAEPPFTSQRIHIRNRKYGDQWRHELTLNRIQDMIDPDTNELRTNENITLYIEEAFDTVNGQVSMLYNSRTIPIKNLLAQWQSFADDVGRDTIKFAAGENTSIGLSNYSDIAHRMMTLMGWTPGKPLRERGIIDPIEVDEPCHNPRSGLGHKARYAHTHPTKNNKTRLMGTELEGVTIYGYASTPGTLDIAELTVQGKPRATGTSMAIPHSLLRKVLWWDGGVKGIAEFTFPHPKGWTYEGSALGTTFEHMSIRRLTAIFRNKTTHPPNCIKAWSLALHFPSPWTEIWRRFTNPILTPRDSKNQLTIIHRRLFTRNHDKAAPSNRCRCCNNTMETFSHLAVCEKIKEIWSPFLTHFKLEYSQELIFLGQTSPITTLQGGISVLHIILWKFILIAFTQVDLEGTTFNPKQVWKNALWRLQDRLTAYTARASYILRRAHYKGNPTPDLTTHNKWLAPLAFLQPDKKGTRAILTILEPLKTLLSDAGIGQKPHK